MLLVPKIAKVTKRFADRFKDFALESKGEDGICEFEFSMFLQLQNDFYGDDIDEQCEIQNIIDYLYFKNVWIIKSQFFLFILGFMIPFFVQITAKENPSLVVLTNTICLFTQCVFMLQELR